MIKKSFLIWFGGDMSFTPVPPAPPIPPSIQPWIDQNDNFFVTENNVPIAFTIPSELPESTD